MSNTDEQRALADEALNVYYQQHRALDPFGASPTSEWQCTCLGCQLTRRIWLLSGWRHDGRGWVKETKMSLTKDMQDWDMAPPPETICKQCGSLIHTFEPSDRCTNCGVWFHVDCLEIHCTDCEE